MKQNKTWCFQAAKPWLKANVFLGSYWSKPPDAPRAPRLPATVTKDAHLRNWAPHWALETFSPGPRYAPDSLLHLHLFPLLFTIVYQKMPLWCNWSKGLWCHIHSLLKPNNVFFSPKNYRDIVYCFTTQFEAKYFWIEEQMFLHFLVAAWLTKDKTFMTAAQWTNCEFLVSLSFCP